MNYQIKKTKGSEFYYIEVIKDMGFIGYLHKDKDVKNGTGFTYKDRETDGLWPTKESAERFLELYQRSLVDADIAAGKIPDVLADNLERREELHNKDGSYKSIAICLSTTATKPEYESFGTANLCIVGTQIVTELMEITPKDLRMLARMFKEFADRIDQLTEEQAP